MPILWRFLHLAFTRIFLLSVTAFVSILVVSRFKEIARFGALSSSLIKTCLFVFYQIPLILPMAIPISALITSLLLMHNFSRSLELTAIRASGISLKTVFYPLLFASLFLTLISFVFTSTITPFARREVKLMLFRETTANPLLLLQRQQLVKLKSGYFDMEVIEEGKSAENVTLIAKNGKTGCLTLFRAKTLHLENDFLQGEGLSIISYLPPGPPSLLIENQASMRTKAPLLSEFLKKHHPRLDASTISFPLLKRSMAEKGKIKAQSQMEMFRRFSLSLAPCTFVWLGLAFGIDLGRAPSKKGILAAVFLATLLFLSYFLAKSIKHQALLALFVLLIPHLIIYLASSLRLKKIAGGTL